MTTVKMNVEDVIKVAAQSGEARIRRAAMLMAYGWNCSHQADEVDFRLEGFVQFIKPPNDFTSEQMEMFRSDFRAWTIGNGLMELVTALEGVLDFLHMVLIRSEFKLKNKRSKEAEKACRKFEQQGLALKFAQLERRFHIHTGFGTHFETLTAARNCLTHRHGIVAEKDCNDDGTLDLTWLGANTSITEPNGREHSLSLEKTDPLDTSKFEGEGNAILNIEWVDRSMKFSLGERIDMSPRELQEICQFSILTCLKLSQHSINWLLDQGVEVNNGVPVPEPTVNVYLEEIVDEG